MSPPNLTAAIAQRGKLPHVNRCYAAAFHRVRPTGLRRGNFFALVHPSIWGGILVRCAPVNTPHATNFAWLLKLRWGAAAGQLAIIVIVRRYLAIAIPLWWVLPIIGVELATNAAAWVWARGREEVPEAILAAVMVLDVGLLTALLYLTGGSFNPFNFLYLVHIALAAVVLRPSWAWGLTLMAVGCCGALFYGHSVHEVHTGDIGLHLEGMWVAFGVAAVFIVYFVQRVTRALADRDAELAAVRDRTARHDKLASLATLAAGAAHELSTPLSTIALTAKELERQVARTEAGGNAAADAHMIRQQVERCREILTRMVADAGESAGEPFVLVNVGELIEAALAAAPERERVQVRVERPTAEQPLRIPIRAVVRALHALIDNARQAAPPPAPIRMEVTSDAAGCRIAVVDQGVGMSRELLARAGEPFFTTRPPRKGMGLGLFLTQTLLERLGGRLELISTPGRGTTAAVSLPTASPATHRHTATPANADAA
jgi:two-component system, sensor histidine kinase RegB